MERKTEKPRRSRATLGQEEFGSLFPTVPALSCSSLPQELPGWGIGKHLKTTLQKGGEMESTLIPSHLAESTPLGGEGKFPALDVSFQKIPNANRDYFLLCITKVLFKQKHSPGASYQHFGFRFCSKLFISPQPNVHPYRKQILLGGSWVVLNIFWGWFLTLKLQMQQEVSILF